MTEEEPIEHITLLDYEQKKDSTSGAHHFKFNTSGTENLSRRPI